MKAQRIQALTGIRAIAAMMVFLYHNRKYWREDIPHALLKLLNEFHTGVAVFFVLSGFLIAYTYREKPLASGKEYGKYLLVRFARIFPMYLLILTASYIDNGFPGTPETILTYTLAHGFSDTWNLHGIAQAWSLTVEMSFYILAPFIYVLTKRSIGKTLLILIVFLGLTLAVGYGWHWWNGNRYGYFYPANFVFNSTFAGRFPEFFSGILLGHYLLKHQENGLANKKFLTLTGGILSLAVIYAISCFEPNIYGHGTDVTGGMILRNVVFPASVVMLLYGLITERTWVARFLGSPPMVLLGNASFIFYLIHISYVNMKLRNLYLFPDRNFILLWIVSVILYLIIEKPLYEWLKGMIKKL